MKRFLSLLPLAALVGTLSGAIIVGFKYFAALVGALFSTALATLQNHLWGLLPAIGMLLLAAFAYSLCYKRLPTLMGGGIPISVAAIRDLVDFKGGTNLVGVFCLSLASFLIGMPLGTEGPAVQMGTALAALVGKYSRDKNTLMTSGAAAGFAAVTGAPVSGLLFTVEEAGKKDTASLLVSGFGVLFAYVTSCLLSPLCGVSVRLLAPVALAPLPIKYLWVVALFALLMGLFAAAFSRGFRATDKLINGILSRVPLVWRIFAVFVLTLLVGTALTDAVGSGHHLLQTLLAGKTALPLLLLLLVVRSLLTLGVNVTGVTGGIFLPQLVIGGTVGAALATLFCRLGLPQEHYPLFIMLGLTACIAGMMRLPLTACVFSLELLSLSDNMPALFTVAVLTFATAFLTKSDSIAETLICRRENAQKPTENPTKIPLSAR